jgi:tyrosinase
MNLWSSPNDPLFYLHHANLDRIWSIWQRQSSINLYDIGGPIFPNGTGLITLDYRMEMGQFMAPSLPIRTVMDTLNWNGHGLLCYQYEVYNEP